MNVIENIHEARFPNISVLLHIVHYISPLTIIVALALEAVGQTGFQQHICNAL